MQLKETSRMLANRANSWRSGTYYDMSAVAAFPDLYFTAFENLLGFYIVEQLSVTFFVSLFNGTYLTEAFCQIVEAFFVGFFSHTVIHIGPFHVFAFCSMLKVFSGLAAKSQFVEPHLGVSSFVVSGFFKNSCNLFKALFSCCGSEECVFIS